MSSSVPPGSPVKAAPDHSHPTPLAFRVGAVCVGIGVAVAGTSFAVGLLNSSDEDEAQKARTRSAVCAILPDLPTPSDRVRELAAALECPVDAAGDPLPPPAVVTVTPPAPLPSPPADVARGGTRPTPAGGEPASSARAPSSSRPGPSSSPSTRPSRSPEPEPERPPPSSSPSPRPSPSPTPCPVPTLPAVGCPDLP